MSMSSMFMTPRSPSLAVAGASDGQHAAEVLGTRRRHRGRHRGADVVRGARLGRMYRYGSSNTSSKY